MSIIEVDFGKEKRERDRLAIKAFQKLIGLIEEVDKDPGKYLSMANEEISRLQRVLVGAEESLQSWVHAEVLTDSSPQFPMLETMRIGVDEYKRLKACEKIIRGWRA